MSHYGPLMLKDRKKYHHLFGKGGKHTKVYNQILNWFGAPRPVEVTINMARCLKDKVASGSYVIIMRRLERIGGNMIHAKYKESYRRLIKVKEEIIGYERDKEKFM
jgi:hypothetical protein